MRWGEKPLKHRYGDKRFVERFLLFPLTLFTQSREKETRWLEWARIEQRRLTCEESGIPFWSNWEWADDPALPSRSDEYFEKERQRMDDYRIEDSINRIGFLAFGG